MGKDYLTDVLESKRTLMAIHCLVTAEPADRERLVTLLRKRQDKTTAEAAEIVGLMERYGSIDYARSFARDLIAEGRSDLEVLPPSRARDILAAMAVYFLAREK